MTKTTKAGADAPKAPEAPKTAQESPIIKLIRYGVQNGLLVLNKDAGLGNSDMDNVKKLLCAVNVVYSTFYDDAPLSLESFCITLLCGEQVFTPEELNEPEQSLRLYLEGVSQGVMLQRQGWKTNITYIPPSGIID